MNFRRMFDVRLTEEYNGVAGEPYSFQDGSGELAGMAIGASLWGAYNQVGEYGDRLTKAGRIGTQYGYRNLEWQPGSPLFHLVRAVGLNVKDYQNVILVNQLGMRFYDETAGQYTANNFHAVTPYKPGSYLNAANIKYNPANFLDAALAGTGEAVNGGGPIWAIFDADAAKREEWTVAPPYVDPDGYFFSAKSVSALAASDCEQISAQAHIWRCPRKKRRALQLFCGCGKRCGFREAHSQVQNPDAAVLRGLGHARHPRHASGTSYQCEVPGDRFFRQRNSRSLLRR